MEPIKVQIGSMKNYAEIFRIEDLLELKLEMEK
jgi:metal-dependent HD superfamily phosphatase/phosphodiesterase